MKIKFKDSERGDLNIPLIYFIVFGTAAIGGLVFFKLGFFPMLPCHFKEFTGHPCPTCGTTRLVLALYRFDLKSAFFYNPFVFVSGVIFGLWALTGFFPVFFRKKLVISFSSFEKKVFLILILILFLLNWAYLWVNGI